MIDKYKNLMRIDTIINSLEFYLRGKFRAKFGFCRVLKSFNSKSHFVVDYEGIKTNYKYTTSCYIPKETLENPLVRPTIAEDGLPDSAVFLKIPRGEKIRVKNWGEADYIVCSYQEKSNREVSYVYYIKREDLFNYLNKGKELFEDFISWDIGIPLRTLMKNGVVTEVDKLYWKQHRAETLFVKDGEKSYFYFINYWKGKNEEMATNNKTAFFPDYKPVPYADRKKKIVLTAESGNSVSFNSITEAATTLEITEVSISRLLHKKQNKLFASKDGKKIRIVKVEELVV